MCSSYVFKWAKHHMTFFLRELWNYLQRPEFLNLTFRMLGVSSLDRISVPESDWLNGIPDRNLVLRLVSCDHVMLDQKL